MKEGAWISSPNGRWAWVDDHALWILRPGNTTLLGLGTSPSPDLHTHAHAPTRDRRHKVLLWAMVHGLIRVRGHGPVTTFEFTIPFPDMLKAARPFMQKHFGPLMGCRFNNLRTGESRGGMFMDLDDLPAWVSPEDTPTAGLQEMECAPSCRREQPTNTPGSFRLQVVFHRREDRAPV